MWNATGGRKRQPNIYNGKKSAPSDDAGPGRSNVKGQKAGTPPTTITIDGVDVHFPFRPYDVQRDYMAAVLQALKQAQHALLESPTGTGKTLCLLCAALAWQRMEKGRIMEGKHTDNSLSQPLLPNAEASASQLSQGATEGSAPPTSSNKPPVIIYASRTHSQLSQVVGELRNTRYRPRHAVLGSREHTCIHPRVNPSVAKGKANGEKKTASEVNNGCNKLNKERKCLFRNNLDDAAGKGGAWRPPSREKQEAGKEYQQPVLDIEDIVAVGREHKICPFYHTRSLLKDAELIFVPYNYLFDRDARETTLAEVDFENAILIFDEAHNLEEFASESSSFDLNSSDVAGCVGEVQRALQYLELNPGMEEGTSMKDNMLRLKTILLNFEKYLCGDIAAAGTTGMKLSSAGEASHPGEFILDVFKHGAGITHDNLALFTDFVKRVQDVVMEFKGSSSSSGTPKLDHFLACLKRSFGTGTKLLALARAKSYRVHVSKLSKGGGGFSEGRTISYWCFAPALAMRELSFLKVRSILITSGTLSPLPSFSMELGLDFPVQLENDHVIQPDQIFVRVVGKGVSGKELSSKFGRRDDLEYISELGSTLASLCRNIPGGVLVFFPSYSAMESAVSKWGGPTSERFGGRSSGGKGAAFFAAKRKKHAAKKYVFPMVPPSFRAAGTESSPWQRLLARKTVVLEPRSTSDLTDAISEYKKALAMPKSAGAILMGVCRGKISEGIDFSDDMCRAVVVTGLPFAPYLDPKVKLKREFLDAARASSKTRPSIDGGFGNGQLVVKAEGPTPSRTLSGAEWYNQQAHRAVNQAIGRVIRHRHDYGAVLLLDHRFAEARNKDGLSKWLRPHLRDDSFGLTNKGLINFYKESKANAERAKAARAKEQGDSANLPPKSEEDEDEISKMKEVQYSQRDLEEDAALTNGYIDRKSKNIDLNEPTASAKKALDTIYGVNDSFHEESISPKATGLGSLYSKGKTKSQPTNHSSIAERKASSFGGVERKASSFGDIERKPAVINSRKFAKREPVRQRPQPKRKSDAATAGAKKFFETAQTVLSVQDLAKVSKLLVAMKGYGQSKNDGQYVKSAKELISVLVESNVDSKRIQLIISLFPLLPVKYRYKIEKMAAILAFEKSPLRARCKESLSDTEFTAVKTFVLPMIFSESSNNSIAYSDRALLEDSQKLLKVLVKHEVSLQLFFDMLPERQLRRVRTLALELKKSQGAGPFESRSTKPVVRKQPSLKADDAEDGESQEAMKQALSQAMSTNQQKKDRVTTFQKNAKQPINPYRKAALKDSTKRNLPASGQPVEVKRVRANNASHASRTTTPAGSSDMVDDVLQQVNSVGYVQPKTRREQITSKINTQVPRGFVCPICSEKLNEPLAGNCDHYACSSCWKSWLKRHTNCPTCRASTQWGDLSYVSFQPRAQLKSAEVDEDEEDELQLV